MEDLFKLVLVVAMFGSAVIDLFTRARKSRSPEVEPEEEATPFDWMPAPQPESRPVPAPVLMPRVEVPLPPRSAERTTSLESRRPEIRNYDEAVEARPRSLMSSAPASVARPVRGAVGASAPAEAGPRPREVMRRTLRSPSSLRQALVMAEVLGPPPGLSRALPGDRIGG